MIRVALKFGAFVVVCLLFTLYLAFTIGNLDFRDPLDREHYRLSATFDDVTGLLLNDNVKVAGVVVGKVTSVKAEDGKALVEFQIDNDHTNIPNDSFAAIRWRNLIGQRYLYLYPGDSPEAFQDGDVVCPDPDVCKNVEVIDLGALFNELGPIVGAIDPGQVNQLLETLTQALDGREDKVGAALDDLAVLAKGLASRDDAIQRLVTNLETVAGTLNERDAQIEAMLENLVALSDAFGDNTATLDAALDRARRVRHRPQRDPHQQRHGARPDAGQPGPRHRHRGRAGSPSSTPSWPGSPRPTPRSSGPATAASS